MADDESITKRPRGRPRKPDALSGTERSRRHRDRQAREIEQLRARLLELERQLADRSLLHVDLSRFDRAALVALVGENLDAQQRWVNQALSDQIQKAARNLR
ncbi:MAG: hypothetical protein MZV65_43085 [Chromatiales bacterium]|nr:hypothetical protein [Chromatiales bacterium]